MSLLFNTLSRFVRDSQVALVLKNLAAKAEDIRDPGSIPGWGRSPAEENSNRVYFLGSKITADGDCSHEI